MRLLGVTKQSLRLESAVHYRVYAASDYIFFKGIIGASAKDKSSLASVSNFSPRMVVVVTGAVV